MNESTRAPRALTWGRILRIFVLYVVVPVILVGMVVWSYSGIRARADLDREIAWVRARNEPLLLSELNDYYTPDPTRPNMTAELEAALDLVESLGKRPEAKFIPFVGELGPKDIPSEDQPWNDETSIRKFMVEAQPALDCFRTAAEQNATARYSIDFVKTFHRVRRATGFLTLAARVHSRDKNFDATIEAIKCQIALSNTIDRHPCGASQMTRIGVLREALAEIARLAQNEVLTDAQLAELQKISMSFDLKNVVGLVVAGDRPFGYSMAVERRWGVPDSKTVYYRWSMSDPNKAVQPPPDQQSNRPFWIRDAEFYLQTMRRAAEASETDNIKLADEVKQIVRDIRKLESSGVLSKIKYLATAEMAPGLETIVKVIADRNERQIVTHTGIAVIRYREKNGQLPAGIAELVPEFLNNVPVVPTTGAPLVYQVDKNAATVSGHSFVFEVKAK